MKTLIRAWKDDWNFRITIVFGVLFFIDAMLHDGWVHRWISIPYFTSVTYGIVMTFLRGLAFRKFRKRQEKLECRFQIAMKKEDMGEAGRVLKLLTDNLKEYREKIGFEPYKKEEL